MGSERINIAVLVSGRGSNMQALIDACAEKTFPARIGLVISNIADVYALERAKDAGIETAVVPHKDFDSREEFEDALLKTLSEHDIDAVCLAGFMRILTPRFITPWDGRMINIHPSLLPDYKGLNTHERALTDGRTEAGCTVHYVVPDVDSGEIITQRRVPIMEDDTPDTLAARVLKEEHIAYPQALEHLAKKLLGA